MTDLPHGTVGHVGVGCDQCPDAESYHLVVDDSEFGRVEIGKTQQSFVATNGRFGGWVKQKDGSYVAVAHAKSMNRRERRRKGIKL